MHEDSPQIIAISAHSAGPRYRSDIDGLRAVAVASVVVFHGFPSLLKGGFVGVDIFFVISGYLIGGIILDGLAAGSFSFGTFYARRVRRIFPALLLVLFACYGFGWFQLLADEFKQLGAQIAGGAGFISNLVLWHQAGYFDTLSEKKPLLHLWSLGIEEQFYLAWPIGLWLASKVRRGVVLAIIAVWVASFVLNVVSVRHDPVAAFYSPLSRFWELMTGCGLAWLKSSQRVNFQQRANFVALAGAALIVSALALLDAQSQFPGWWALLPTTGAALVIAAGPHAWLNRAVLSNKGVVWIGLVSYPLYLWHWPLLAFGRILEAETPSVSWRLGALVASVCLAAVTTFVVERPIRSLERGAGVRVAVLCILMLGVGYAGVNTYQRNGLGFRLTAMAGRFTSTQFDVKTAWREHTCFLDGNDEPRFGLVCDAMGSGPLVVVWGDSFAAALYPGIHHLQERYSFRLAQYTASGCPPFLPSDSRESRCKAVHEQSLIAIGRDKPDLVIVDANWASDDLPKISRAVAALRQMGVRRIALIGTVPHWRDSLPDVYWAYWRKEDHRMLPARSNFKIDPAFAGLNDSIRALAGFLKVNYVDAYGAMCDGSGCLTRTGPGKGEIVAFDQAHLTPSGSAALVDLVANQLVIPSIADRRHP